MFTALVNVVPICSPNQIIDSTVLDKSGDILGFSSFSDGLIDCKLIFLLTFHTTTTRLQRRFEFHLSSRMI